MAGVIVVGVDGSEPSRAALAWAVKQAELTDARLVAIHAWVFVPPGPLAEPGMLPAAGVVDFEHMLKAEEEAARAELESALADAFPDGIPERVEPKLVDGDPGLVLEAEAEKADLAVVGHRGRSGLASVLLGSVSRHLVDKARCPVVVVKAQPESRKS